jgi:site-specific DNA-methyltransferase (adenine-specific)
MLAINNIYCDDCVIGMKKLDSDTVDMVITSPPYDNLRDYKGYNFNLNDTILELYRVVKIGGVVVWVVGDSIVNGNKTLTSFKQALAFQDSGFNVHDVMIYKKKNTPFMRSNAYTNCFEYMFIFSKGKPKTFNPLKDRTARSGYEMLVHNKSSDGVNKKALGKLNSTKTKTNIWEYAVGLGGSTNDKIAFKHPAIFPEQLAIDHILSWSNDGDLVLDPFMGSGTVAKACILTHRKYIGFEISEEYCKIAKERLNNISYEMRGFRVKSGEETNIKNQKKLF